MKKKNSVNSSLRSSKKMNQASLKQDKGESVTFNFEGNVRSSTELLKRFKIKREKLVVGNAERTNAARMKVQGPKQKPMFSIATQKQGLTSTRQLNPIQKKSNIANINEASKSGQNQYTVSQFVSTSQKKLPIEASITQAKGSRQNHDPKSQVVSINQKKLPMEAIMTQSKGSSQHQDPKSQSVSTSKKKLPMKAYMAENKGSSQKQGLKRQAVKKVATQDDDSRAMQQSPMKKTKRIPVCPPMLMINTLFLVKEGKQYFLV